MLESTYCRQRWPKVQRYVRRQREGLKRKKRLTRGICSWKNTEDIFGIDLATGDNGGHSIGPFHKHGPYQYPFVAHDWVRDKILPLSLSPFLSLSVPPPIFFVKAESREIMRKLLRTKSFGKIFLTLLWNTWSVPMRFCSERYTFDCAPSGCLTLKQ